MGNNNSNTNDAVNEGCVWKVYGVFDTVENRTRLPSALGQILQRLSAHRVSSLGIGMGGT